MTLSVSSLVSTSVTLAASAAQGENFGDTLLLGDSNVISGLEREREYASISEVGGDFSNTSPEYLGALNYFGQTPTPTLLTIGRWLRTPTASILEGQILNATQSALSQFLPITMGGFNITFNDGTPTQVTNLNFSQALNLNGVASIVTAALSGAGTCLWTGSQFEITSAESGAGVNATGTIEFTANPANTDTVTVNGLSIEFVTTTPTGNQVLIGSSAASTAVNLNTFLTNSVNPDLTVLTFSVTGTTVTVSAAQVGLAGNAYTLAEGSTAITLSGSTLTGGLNPSSVSYATSPVSSQQDVSTLMGLTAATAIAQVPGYNAESALSCVQAHDTFSTSWYSMGFASSVMPSTSDNVSIAAFIEADNFLRVFGVSTQDTSCLSSLVTNDVGSLLQASGYQKTMSIYSSVTPYAVFGIFGRTATVDYTGSNTTINLMYKQLPFASEDLDTDEALALKNKRINVFAAYNNGTSILQYGVMASNLYIDERDGIDWLSNAEQTALFNALYTTTTKIAQTDAGSTQLGTVVGSVLDQGVTNGLIAPGIYQGAPFGSITTGQYLKTGWSLYIPPVSSQSQAARAARAAPPIQGGFIFAGAINTVSVALTASR